VIVAVNLVGNSLVADELESKAGFRVADGQYPPRAAVEFGSFDGELKRHGLVSFLGK
jgi:hypothetical protein